jgi:hypothetical protein
VALAVHTFQINYHELSLPKITAFPSTPPSPLEFSIHASSSARLLVFHPGLPPSDHYTKFLDVLPGNQYIELPLQTISDAVANRWFVIPFLSDLAGASLGVATEGTITTPFHVGAGARYYAVTGDQLGVGPLPPRVGEPTKYWVQWKLNPTTNDVSQFVMQADLPEGVELTGHKALPDGGELSQKNRTVIWSVPFLPASNQGISASFEVAFTPTSALRGTVPLLLKEASASAIENRSGVVLRAETGVLDTNLASDERGAGKGVVR